VTLPGEIPTLLQRVIAIGRSAGEKVLTLRRSGCSVDHKAGGHPVTAADRASHDVIITALRGLSPRMPIISEEADLPPYVWRAEWPRFWLVDPLDGTKEFVAGSREFTVNIALVEERGPVLGVVVAPALGVMYFAADTCGAWKQVGDGAPGRIFSADWEPSRPARVVESRSHPSEALDRFMSDLPVAERLQVGSSLKFCLVAEGAADLYPRFGPMMEWDAAAGDCIYRFSGRTRQRPCSIRYNQPDLRIPSFVIGADHLASASVVI
jgi:3'(2'), 5'-bisphosphate nucleotidase